MNKVQILPPEIASKIAAGEVIERPASVVKELMENALDAQTDAIEVHLKQAGKTLIHIKDTGIGIEPDDTEKIFLRHATSKISALADLYRINSLGFRGEALYSIAAISDITLRTKTKSHDTGWEVHLRADKKLSKRPVSLGNGTEIEVKELFFNTPARKKFLKSDTTELNQILNIFIPYALIYPDIRFLLTHNGKNLIDLPSDKNHIRRIAETLNLSEEHIIEAQHYFSETDILIHLILGDINIQRTNKELQFIFINNRPVQSRSIGFHMNDVYRLIMPGSMHPFFYVSIKIPPENIDVNVHPTKREVKIKNESSLIAFLRAFCEKTLMTSGKAKQIKGTLFNIKETPAQYSKDQPVSGTKVSESSNQQYFIRYSRDAESQKEPFLTSQIENIILEQKDNLKNKLSDATYIGTFKKQYLLFETPNSLLLIDQHAAHERITYEKLKKQIEEGRIEIQDLLTPFLLTLTHQEMLNWEEVQKKLETIGFSTTLWDKRSIAIHSQPHLISNPEIAVRNILSVENIARCDLDTLARWACRQSVMAGDQIKKNQAEYLRAELLKCSAPFNCPHGRPTVVEIAESFLNKQFLRQN